MGFHDAHLDRGCKHCEKASTSCRAPHTPIFGAVIGDVVLTASSCALDRFASDKVKVFAQQYRQTAVLSPRCHEQLQEMPCGLYAGLRCRWAEGGDNGLHTGKAGFNLPEIEHQFDAYSFGFHVSVDRGHLVAAAFRHSLPCGDCGTGCRQIGMKEIFGAVDEFVERRL